MFFHPPTYEIHRRTAFELSQNPTGMSKKKRVPKVGAAAGRRAHGAGRGAWARGAGRRSDV